MKLILLSAPLMIIMLMLASCNKSKPAGQIWPIESGNTWVYLDTLFDTTGAVHIVGNQPSAVSTDSLVDGEKWYHLSGDRRLYTNRSDGLWVMRDTSDSSVQNLLFKYPCKVGDIWNYGRGQVTVQSTDTTLTVPAGTYSCYKYVIQRDAHPVEYCYLCLGVGFIRADHFLTTNSGRLYKNYTGELKSVTIK